MRGLGTGLEARFLTEPELILVGLVLAGSASDRTQHLGKLDDRPRRHTRVLHQNSESQDEGRVGRFVSWLDVVCDGSQLDTQSAGAESTESTSSHHWNSTGSHGTLRPRHVYSTHPRDPDP